MNIVPIFLFIITIFCLSMAILCFYGGKSKLYCYLFEHQEWVGWEKVVKNFDNIKYEEYFDAESTPNLNNYTFSVVIDGVENRVKYWELEGTVSVHGWVNGQECLCGFDQYHQKVVKDLLCEKFDFMKEIMGRSANRL